MLKLNSHVNRKFDLGSYISLFNLVGKTQDFTSANFVAEWYRRNLLMYSLVQK
ncbi:hypothetical protein JJC03_11325 [Flavobacterium oreochromis]|nr:hypothetical protein JJC03_11325 [Flavobacterium oreochromis]